MINFFGFHLPVWAVGVALYALWLGLGWSLKKVLFSWLRVLTSKTETRLDDAFISAANFPLTIMIAVWGAAAIIHIVARGLPVTWSHAIGMASKVATLGAVVLFVDLLILNLLEIYASKVEALRGSQTFASAIVHVVLFTLGLLIVLDSIGISVTPIIASLGIGSLAVALALQPTFENIFSGFQILIDRPVIPGQFIKLETGEEGYVEKIGWRSTWIRQLPNNTVIIPNKLLVNARVINYHYPSKDLAVSVDLGVHYDSDLDKVERVTIEVGEQVMRTVAGGVPEFKPLIRYHSLGPSSIDFSVVLRGKEYVDTYLIKHEFIKALIKRYRHENIVIPYPITAINTTQEKPTNPIYKS